MNRQLKKILITGGTGFIGQQLCEHLLKEGYMLYILTRNKKLNGLVDNPTKFYLNNLSEIQNIDIDIFINLAGETIAQRWTDNAKQSIYSSRVATTRTLVNFMRSKKIKPTLFLSGSAVGYYGAHHEKTFTEENSAPTIRSKFASSLCKAWEDEASRAIGLGIRTVLLRIGPVLEKDGGMLAKILPSFHLGLGSQIGDGQQWLSWIDRADLIKLILFIIHQQNIDGPVNATSPNPITNKQFSLALAEALHRPCFLKTPNFVFKLIFGQMAEEIMLNGQKVLPEKALHHGFEFSYPTISQSFSKIFSS
ncbi:MAG: TIGR01777 family oxidoreductase [Alphaproteobacteria bacterium]